MTGGLTCRYRVVDVFTTRQLEGNALAVFPRAAGLDDQTMQRIARELNLAETVFIFPAGNDECAARLRIFTPTKEMDFAGHPTVGASFVLLDEGMAKPYNGGFVVEENVGRISIRVEEGDRPMIWLTTPPIRDKRTFDPDACAKMLGLTPDDLMPAVVPQILDAGNPTLFIALRDQSTVDRASLDPRALASLRGLGDDRICVFIFTPSPEGAYSRMFAPEYGVVEDPATGSSTGPLALFMMRHGFVSRSAGTRFISEQGTKMGRRSILHVNIRGEMGCDGIEVGGNVTPVATASMNLDR